MTASGLPGRSSKSTRRKLPIQFFPGKRNDGEDGLVAMAAGEGVEGTQEFPHALRAVGGVDVPNGQVVGAGGSLVIGNVLGGDAQP